MCICVSDHLSRHTVKLLVEFFLRLSLLLCGWSPWLWKVQVKWGIIGSRRDYIFNTRWPWHRKQYVAQGMISTTFRAHTNGSSVVYFVLIRRFASRNALELAQAKKWALFIGIELNRRKVFARPLDHYVYVGMYKCSKVRYHESASALGRDE